MKIYCIRFLKTAALLISASSLLAQPILHQPQLVTGLTNALFGTEAVQVPAGGENQVWDYGKKSGSF